VTGNTQTGSGIVGASSGEVATISEATLPESTNNKRRRTTEQLGSDAIESNKRRRTTEQPGLDAIESNQNKPSTRSKAKAPYLAMTVLRYHQRTLYLLALVISQHHQVLLVMIILNQHKRLIQMLVRIIKIDLL